MTDLAHIQVCHNFSSKEQASFNFMPAVTFHNNSGTRKLKFVTVSIFLIYLSWSDGTWCHDLSFSECWVLSQVFPLPSFTFIKRLFSSSLLSAIPVVSCAYMRLLIFLLAILIPAWASSSPAFSMLYFSLDLLISQFGTSPLFHVPF